EQLIALYRGGVLYLFDDSGVQIIQPEKYQTVKEYTCQPTLQKSTPNIQGLSLAASPTKIIEYDSSGVLEIEELFAGGSKHGIIQGLQDFLQRLSPPFPPSKQHFIFVVPENLKFFSCQHSTEGFLQIHAPYIAKVSVESTADKSTDYVGIQLSLHRLQLLPLHYTIPFGVESTPVDKSRGSSAGEHPPRVWASRVRSPVTTLLIPLIPFHGQDGSTERSELVQPAT
ncbi:1361_t:CDS:2, partial [Acaulospora colombiana]